MEAAVIWSSPSRGPSCVGRAAGHFSLQPAPAQYCPSHTTRWSQCKATVALLTCDKGWPDHNTENSRLNNQHYKNHIFKHIIRLFIRLTTFGGGWY
ncbi:hypothetical protein CEXT_281221 [Caerostris extrusa]|uniref:Uncharacterized protein n=1 Tax=Caerostris extrusa TaxID=172846 RepID=A0AAV4Y2B7_CAEEX|nr:hypothetical protein CEXT_281221 [Caerostris extrusa]